MISSAQSRMADDDRAIALYHVVYENEEFDEAARALFKLVEMAQRRFSGRERKLFLDIEGHRDNQGAFDAEMVELQTDFLVGVLGPYLSEIHAPLFQATNPNPQRNDLPPALIIKETED